MRSKIFLSTIIHKRFFPFKHQFKYIVPSLFLNLNDLKNIEKKFAFFSINRFNLFSFNEKDHGYRDDRKLEKFVKDYLNKKNIKFDNLKIMILCFPRIIGYVFNPLSIIYCFNNENLISIFYEVKNTSNEQHTYFFKGDALSKKIQLKHSCSKQFYVSPFIGMKAYYDFKNSINNKKINVTIDLFDQNNQKILTATQYGDFKEIGYYGMLKYLLLNPFLTFKVMGAILFEAFRIIVKGGKYYSRQKKPNDTITFEGSF